MPTDLRIRHEPRPMTIDEAAGYYLEHTEPYNHVVLRWDCAEAQRGGPLTWDEERVWFEAVCEVAEERRVAFEAARWPDRIAGQVARLVGEERAQNEMERRARRLATLDDAIRSGYLIRAKTAAEDAGSTRDVIRRLLRLEPVRESADPCSEAASGERRQRDRSEAIGTRTDLVERRLVGLLVDARFLAVRRGPDGSPVLHLTPEAAAATRSMPGVGDAETDQDLFTWLLGPGWRGPGASAASGPASASGHDVGSTGRRVPNNA